MQVAPLVEPVVERSPLAAVRLRRKLTEEQAARRAGLTADQITWLEEGRVYRFPSPDDALVALLLYATALGVDEREARTVAGLPVTPKVGFAYGRLATVLAIGAALIALLITLVPGLELGGSKRNPDSTAAALPPPWKITVDVLNGGGDINYTRQIASRIGALGYRIKRVGRADRFDYQETAVFYERGGEAVAGRLAGALGSTTRPLPGGTNGHRLVVVVGPARGPG